MEFTLTHVEEMAAALAAEFMRRRGAATDAVSIVYNEKNEQGTEEWEQKIRSAPYRAIFVNESGLIALNNRLCRSLKHEHQVITRSLTTLSN